MNIYQINEDFLKIQELLENNGGEITEEIATAIEKNNADFETKIENMAKLSKQLDADCDVINARIKELQEMKKTKENGVKRLKQYICNALHLRGEDKIKTATMSGYIKISDVVSIDDVTKLDDRYFVIKKEISKTLIKDALKSGEEVEGASMAQTQSFIFKL